MSVFLRLATIFLKDSNKIANCQIGTPNTCTLNPRVVNFGIFLALSRYEKKVYDEKNCYPLASCRISCNDSWPAHQCRGLLCPFLLARGAAAYMPNLQVRPCTHRRCANLYEWLRHHNSNATGECLAADICALARYLRRLCGIAARRGGKSVYRPPRCA